MKTVISLVIGLVVGFLIGSGGSITLNKAGPGAPSLNMGMDRPANVQAVAPPHQDLVPVVVPLHDLPAGTRVTIDQLSQRMLPKQLVNDTVVTPDRSNELLNHTLAAPARAGLPIRWSQLRNDDAPFAPRPDQAQPQ